MARKTMISAQAALKNNEHSRLTEIRSLKRQIKALLKKGEAVYVEKYVRGHSYGKLI